MDMDVKKEKTRRSNEHRAVEANGIKMHTIMHVAAYLNLKENTKGVGFSGRG